MVSPPFLRRVIGKSGAVTPLALVEAFEDIAFPPDEFAKLNIVGVIVLCFWISNDRWAV